MGKLESLKKKGKERDRIARKRDSERRGREKYARGREGERGKDRKRERKKIEKFDLFLRESFFELFLLPSIFVILRSHCSFQFVNYSSHLLFTLKRSNHTSHFML